MPLRILALQLKRIGDLVLTAPALAALRRAEPQAYIALGAYGAAAELLSAVPAADAGIAFGPGRGWTPWQQVLTGHFDTVLDFTGSDRSALATVLASAPQRVAFAWVRKSGVRQLVYNKFIDSAVRERHTVDHYSDLLAPLVPGAVVQAGDERLTIPPATMARAEALLAAERLNGEAFALLHPGTARAEKYWLAERWAAVIEHLLTVHGLRCVLTGGSDPFERAHLDAILAATRETAHRAVAKTMATAGAATVDLAGRIDLLTLAALTQRARLVVSCDTATVHLAASFGTPQIALFGPTNPFHWRPRHSLARVISAAAPGAPLTEFHPRAKGAPMDAISTSVVIHATNQLLAARARAQI